MNKNIIYMLSHQPGSRMPKYVTATDDQGISIFQNGVPAEPPNCAFVDFQGVEVMDRMLTSGVELIVSEKTANVLRGLKALR